MYVLRWGRRCARISCRGAAPTTLLCSSTMTTISSAALITVLASSADSRPKKGCHGVMSMPSYHTRLFLCLAHIAAHVRDGGMVHAQTFEQYDNWLDSPHRVLRHPGDRR